MPTRVDSRTDTVSSWTNRRKDLRVIRPAAATAGFFFHAERCLENWLPFDRRTHPSKCFAANIKNISTRIARQFGCAETEPGRKIASVNFRNFTCRYARTANCDEPICAAARLSIFFGPAVHLETASFILNRTSRTF